MNNISKIEKIYENSKFNIASPPNMSYMGLGLIWNRLLK